MHDVAKISLIVALIGLSICVIFFTIFAFLMAGASRNILLGLGTLFGSAVLLCIQLQFELRGSKISEFISTEFTYDFGETHTAPVAISVIAQRKGRERAQRQRTSVSYRPGKIQRRPARPGSISS